MSRGTGEPANESSIASHSPVLPFAGSPVGEKGLAMTKSTSLLVGIRRFPS